MDKEYMMLNLGDEKFAVNSKEVDLEYHQRMNEIIKRYLTKIKTIDVKVAASVKEKEIRKECENAIKEIKEKLCANCRKYVKDI